MDNFFKRTDLVQKAWQKKFGDEITNPQQVDSISAKGLQTKRERYEMQGAAPRDGIVSANLKKYGCEQFFSSDQGRMSLKNLKERYNWSEEALIELSRKRRASVKFGRASKESLKVFIPLYKWLRLRGYKREDVYLGVSGSQEFSVLAESKMFYFDFALPCLGVAIEFHGVKFHARSETDCLLRSDALTMIEKDQKKRSAIEGIGFALLVIWSDEADLLERCKSFITQKEQERI